MQYDEAVELSLSESVDEADVAPPPKPPQVSDGIREPGSHDSGFDVPLKIVKLFFLLLLLWRPIR